MPVKGRARRWVLPARVPFHPDWHASRLLKNLVLRPGPRCGPQSPSFSCMTGKSRPLRSPVPSLPRAATQAPNFQSPRGSFHCATRERGSYICRALSLAPTRRPLPRPANLELEGRTQLQEPARSEGFPSSRGKEKEMRASEVPNFKCLVSRASHPPGPTSIQPTLDSRAKM